MVVVVVVVVVVKYSPGVRQVSPGSWLCGAEIKLKPLSSFYVSKYYDLEAPALLQ